MGDYKLPQDLDREIRSTALARGSRPAKGFLAGALDTHVLLAACSSGEVAREYNKQGLFTAALLELLRKTPVHDLTYFEVLRRLTSIDGYVPAFFCAQVYLMMIRQVKILNVREIIKEESFSVEAQSLQSTVFALPIVKSQAEAM